jgi:hypothetical protein
MATNLVKYVMEISTQGAENALDEVGKSAVKTGKKLDKTGKEADRAGDKMKKSFKAAGVAAAAGAAAILATGAAIAALASAAKEFTMEAVDMINDLGDIGNRSGVAAESIGALKAAFVASGQEASAVVGVLDVTAKRFAQLSKGSKEAEDAFAKYGVTIRDENGNLRSNNDLLVDSMKVIGGLGETSLRSRAALELLGRGGQQLSQALGAGNFQEFLNFTQEFGVVAGPEAAKAAALVQDSISLSQAAFQGFRNALVESTGAMDALARGLQGSMQIFAGLKKVVEANSQLLSTLGKVFFEAFQSIMRALSMLFNDTFSSANTGIEALIENIYLVGAGITRFLLKPLIAASAAASGLAFAFDEELGNSLGVATIGMMEFHNALDPATGAGMKSFKAFTEGASRSMEIFNNLTASSTHSLEDFEIGLEDAGEAAKKTKEEIDPLVESIAMLNDLLGRIGIPRQFQIGGIKEAIEKVKTLGQGLDQAGQEGVFASKFLKADPSIAAQNAAKAIMANSKKLGVTMAILGGAIAGLSKLFGTAVKLAQRGETVGEIQASVEQDLKARAKAIELGLQALPAILFETLPPLFVQLADRIVFGLAKMLAEMFNRLISSIRSLLSMPFNIGDRGERQRERRGEFRRRLGVLGQMAFEGMRSGGRLISARQGMRFTGESAGLALLHKNEFVVPESGQAPQSVLRSMSGGGGINISINAQVVERNAIDELVRQIERRFSTFGSSTSPLFGG